MHDLIVAVHNALAIPSPACAAANLDGDGEITIEELVTIARSPGPCPG